jgi:hypothetical protein
MANIVEEPMRDMYLQASCLGHLSINCVRCSDPVWSPNGPTNPRCKQLIFTQQTNVVAPPEEYHGAGITKASMGHAHPTTWAIAFPACRWQAPTLSLSPIQPPFRRHSDLSLIREKVSKLIYYRVTPLCLMSVRE